MSPINPVNEVKYKMAVSLLKRLLENGLITQNEYQTADMYVAEKYKPVCIAL